MARPGRQRSLRHLAALLAFAAALPFAVRPVVAVEIWIFAIAAMGLNLIFGYTGMLSFGQATFFGLGAYAGGLLLVHFQVPLFAALACGALAGALAAAAIGYLCIQRAGTYFIMLTFGFNQMFYFIAYKWTALTGGDDGLPNVPRPPAALGAASIPLNTTVRYYIFVTVVFFVLFAAMQRIVESPLGMILQAIRERPERAAAVGYNTKLYRWIAFVIAGAYAGLAGVLYGMMFGIVPLDAISFITSGDMVFMVLIGGVGNLYGPILGATGLKWLSEVVSVLWKRWPMILGAALVIVVLFLRGGLVEAWVRARGAVAARRAARGAGAEAA